MRKADIPVILVPVDFSPQSESALLLASKLAACLRARILVLHVVHDPGDGYYAKTLKKKQLHHIEDSAAEMLSDFLARVAHGNILQTDLGKIESLLIRGLPPSRIVEVAEKYQAMMIVMGSTGRTGLEHLMIGSVAERVVQLSPIPVTITKLEKK